MKIVHYLLFTFFLITNCVNERDRQKNMLPVKDQIDQFSSTKFDEYVRNFKHEELPFSFKIADFYSFSIKDFSEIDSLNVQFIPSEIIDQKRPQSFYSLIRFPDRDSNFVLTILEESEMDEYDSYSKLFIVTYDAIGQVIDFEEIGIFYIDREWTEFGIEDDFEIERKRYVYKMNMENSDPNIELYEETLSKLRLKSSGEIELISEKTSLIENLDI